MRRIITKVQVLGGAADVKVSNIVQGPCLVTFIGRDAADGCAAGSTFEAFADPGSQRNTIGPLAWNTAAGTGPVPNPVNPAGRFWLGLPIAEGQSLSVQLRATAGAGNAVIIVEYDDLT